MCSSATSSGVATSWLTKCSVWIYCDELEDKLSSASSSDIDTIQPCVTNSCWDSSLVLIDLFILLDENLDKNLFSSSVANIRPWFLLLLMLQSPPPGKRFLLFPFFLWNVSCLGCVLQCTTSNGVATSWLTKFAVWIYCDELEEKLSSASSSEYDTSLRYEQLRFIFCSHRFVHPSGRESILLLYG